MMGFASQHKRRGVIIDERFVGRSLEIYTVDGDKVLGLVDEVACNEIGMLVEGKPTIVERRAILYAVTGLTDVHGISEGCEKEFVLGEEFIGRDVSIRLVNGIEVRGRLIKVSRNEIGIAQENRALIIPRKSISIIRILGR